MPQRVEDHYFSKYNNIKKSSRNRWLRFLCSFSEINQYNKLGGLMEEILTKINCNLERIASCLETLTYPQRALQNLTAKQLEEIKREVEYYRTQCIIKESK
jgi:hypothetical protein